MPSSQLATSCWLLLSSWRSSAWIIQPSEFPFCCCPAWLGSSPLPGLYKAPPGWCLPGFLILFCSSGLHQLTPQLVLAGLALLLSPWSSSAHPAWCLPWETPPAFGSDNMILPDTGCGLLLVLLPGSPLRWPTSPGWLSGPVCSPPRWPVLHPRLELKPYILAQSLGGFQNLTLTSSPSGGVVSFCWLTATVALPCASSLFHP